MLAMSWRCAGQPEHGSWTACVMAAALQSIVALKSMYPPCRQCLPYQACSNQGETWGRASSLGQQREAGRVARAASGRWAHQAFNVSRDI